MSAFTTSGQERRRVYSVNREPTSRPGDGARKGAVIINVPQFGAWADEHNARLANLRKSALRY